MVLLYRMRFFDVFVADGSYSYWNGILDPVLVKEEGLLKAVMSVNDRLKTTDLHYESYLGTAGRHMFYQVALGYTTIYLAVIFLIIANTLIGVQFLISAGEDRGDATAFCLHWEVTTKSSVIVRKFRSGGTMDWY